MTIKNIQAKQLSKKNFVMKDSRVPGSWGSGNSEIAFKSYLKLPPVRYHLRIQGQLKKISKHI